MKKQSLKTQIQFKWWDIEIWFRDLNKLEWGLVSFLVAMGVILLTLLF